MFFAARCLTSAVFITFVKKICEKTLEIQKQKSQLNFHFDFAKIIFSKNFNEMCKYQCRWTIIITFYSTFSWKQFVKKTLNIVSCWNRSNCFCLWKKFVKIHFVVMLKQFRQNERVLLYIQKIDYINIKLKIKQYFIYCVFLSEI